MIEIKKNILRKVYPKRKLWSHKYDFGSLLVIGGSKRYSGSPAFAALAAYRSGVDVVTVAAPRRAADIVATFSPDMITYPLKGDWLSPEHLRELLGLADKASAVAIGCGLERKKETFKTVNHFLERVEIPAVVDADAIHAVAGKKSVMDGKPVVITPHAREFYALTGIEVKDEIEDRVKKVKETASELKTTILLKGSVDVISDGKDVGLNKTGSPQMTVGGTGDVLTGIVGALLARGVGCFDAACAAAYINGMAGELAAKKFGESMMASDLLEEIPKVLGRTVKT